MLLSSHSAVNILGHDAVDGSHSLNALSIVISEQVKWSSTLQALPEPEHVLEYLSRNNVNYLKLEQQHREVHYNAK